MAERTDNAILAREVEEIILAKKIYKLGPKPRSRGKAVRKKVGEMLEGLDGIGDVMGGVSFDKGDININPKQWESLSGLIMKVAGEQLDDLVDTIYDYWKEELKEDKKKIEDEAMDDEFVAAFMLLMRYVYGPFVSALGIKGNPMATKTARDNGAKESQAAT